MNIYPYVYHGTHKITGQIYIGSRIANKVPAHLDLPIYKTSAPKIKSTFLEFDWVILAEFFDPDDAYNQEQFLIHEQWQISKEQSLNKVCFHGKKAWNTIGKFCSEETKAKMSAKKKGKPHSAEYKANNSASKKGKPHSQEHIANNSAAQKGNVLGPQRPEVIAKRILSLIGKSHSAERRAKNSISQTKLHDFITSEGFILEQIGIKELCSNFNLVYNTALVKFRTGKSYKGFIKI